MEVPKQYRVTICQYKLPLGSKQETELAFFQLRVLETIIGIMDYGNDRHTIMYHFTSRD